MSLSTSNKKRYLSALTTVLAGLFCGLLCSNVSANLQSYPSVDSTTRSAAQPGNEAGTKGTGSAGWSAR